MPGECRRHKHLSFKYEGITFKLDVLGIESKGDYFYDTIFADFNLKVDYEKLFGTIEQDMKETILTHFDLIKRQYERDNPDVLLVIDPTTNINFSKSNCKSMNVMVHLAIYVPRAPLKKNTLIEEKDYVFGYCKEILALI